MILYASSGPFGQYVENLTISSSGHFGDGVHENYENAIFKDNLLLRHRDSSERGGRHINFPFFH